VCVCVCVCIYIYICKMDMYLHNSKSIYIYKLYGTYSKMQHVSWAALFGVGCLTVAWKFFKLWFPFLYTPSRCNISWFCFTSFYKKHKGVTLGPTEGIDPFIPHIKLDIRSIIYRSTDKLYFQLKTICSMKRWTRERKGKLYIGRKYIQTIHLIKVVSILC